MSNYNAQDRYLNYAQDTTQERSVAKFFHMVYLWMAVGLALTGLVSAGIVQFAPKMMVSSPMVALAAGIGAFLLAMAAQRVALQVGMLAGLGLFMAYATVIGIMIAPIWVLYKAETIGVAFLLTGGSFAIMSIIGFITKMDLSKIGAMAIMCAIGLFLASLVNIFLQSSMLGWIITYAVVAIFTIIAIWETQKLKNFAIENAHNSEASSRMAVFGAIVLYITFINLFMAILRILGGKR